MWWRNSFDSFVSLDWPTEWWIEAPCPALLQPCWCVEWPLTGHLLHPPQPQDWPLLDWPSCTKPYTSPPQTSDRTCSVWRTVSASHSPIKRFCHPTLSGTLKPFLVATTLDWPGTEIDAAHWVRSLGCVNTKALQVLGWNLVELLTITDVPWSPIKIIQNTWAGFWMFHDVSSFAKPTHAIHMHYLSLIFKKSVSWHNHDIFFLPEFNSPATTWVALETYWNEDWPNASQSWGTPRTSRNWMRCRPKLRAL